MFLKLDSDRAVILVTNDDGIDSAGLEILAKQLAPLGQIVVSAPDEQRSGQSHAITVGKPLRFFPYPSANGFPTFASSGTPADCVKFAVRRLLPHSPSLVVSGINLGPNTGTNILYSGTVAGAVEASILGIPSLAVSLNTYTDPIYESAAKFAFIIAQKMLKEKIPAGIVLNLNVPNLPWDKIKGLRLTAMGHTNYNDYFEEDRNGVAYQYWLKDNSSWEGNSSESDVCAITEGFASLTPLHFDLTNNQALASLSSWGVSTKP